MVWLGERTHIGWAGNYWVACRQRGLERHHPAATTRVAREFCRSSKGEQADTPELWW